MSNQTSVAVVGYAVGLIGLIGVKILAPGFYAQKDIRTPVKIAVFVLIATQLANLVLVPWLAHAGLALSVSLGACVNAVALFIGLKRRGLYRAQARWGGFVLRLLIALAVLAVVLWLLQRPLDWTAMQSTPWQRAGWLALVIGAGGAAYFAVLGVSDSGRGTFATTRDRGPRRAERKRRPRAAFCIPEALSAELLQHRVRVADLELASAPRCSATSPRRCPRASRSGGSGRRGSGRRIPGRASSCTRAAPSAIIRTLPDTFWSRPQAPITKASLTDRHQISSTPFAFNASYFST